MSTSLNGIIISQCGSEKDKFSCPQVQAYNQFMVYVDLADLENILEVLSLERVLQKWQKKGFFDILDFMLINGKVALKMSADVPGIL